MPEGDEKEPSRERFGVSAEEELRLEVGTAGVTVKLLSGTAEVFGAELPPGGSIQIRNQNLAVFTWYGCELEVEGEWSVAYVAGDTPMPSFAGCHRVLNARRSDVYKRRYSDPERQVENTAEVGPRVVVVGSPDSGKSTLCRILCNYAVRSGWTPTYVDLDVSEGLAANMPGAMAAVQLTQEIAPEALFDPFDPVAYFLGHTEVEKQVDQAQLLAGKLVATALERARSEVLFRASGLVVNTGGWADGQGYDMLLDVIKDVGADVVLVLGQERLYADLKRALGSPKDGSQPPDVVKLSSSGGVVARSKEFRQQARKDRVQTYFYGPGGDLCPHSRVVHFNDLHVHRISKLNAAPLSALPIGMEASFQETVQATRVPITQELKHSILGISGAEEVEGVLAESVVGFVWVSDVDLMKERITYLSPSPEAMPKKFLIAGTLKWFE